MVEVEEIEDEPWEGCPVPAKGFVSNRNPEDEYDETVFAHTLSRERIYIGTKNSFSKDTRWVVELNKEQTKAFARHLLTLVRDMD